MAQDESTYGFNKTDATELVQLIGGGDREYTEGKVRSSGGGNTSPSKIVYAGSGITARSGTTVGSGSCTEYKLSGTTLTTNTNAITVYNLDAIAIRSGQYLLAVREVISVKWIAQHPGIINLRLSGNNLQYTLDGSTWATWTTGTTC